MSFRINGKILTKHSLSPNMLNEDEKEVALLPASDQRTRGSNKVNILYIDELVPNVSMVLDLDVLLKIC